MKKILTLLLVAVMCITCVACGAAKEDIKKELIGTWYYDSYASAVGEHCHQIYKFQDNDKVEVSWINDESPSKSSVKNAMYSVENDHITITYYDGSKSKTIDFTFENNKLKLIDRGTDGSISQKLTKK